MQAQFVVCRIMIDCHATPCNTGMPPRLSPEIRGVLVAQALPLFRCLDGRAIDSIAESLIISVAKMFHRIVQSCSKNSISVTVLVAVWNTCDIIFEQYCTLIWHSILTPMKTT